MPGTAQTADSRFEAALAALEKAGALATEGRFRDGHLEAQFEAASVPAVASTLTDAPIKEADRARLFGLLIAKAAERGFEPAHVMAVGLAELVGDA